MEKQLKNYADLYGYNVLVNYLKQSYTFVSYSQNSIPTVGSMCFNVAKLLESDNVEVHKAINHKDGTVTLKTNLGYLKFWK